MEPIDINFNPCGKLFRPVRHGVVMRCAGGDRCRYCLKIGRLVTVIADQRLDYHEEHKRMVTNLEEANNIIMKMNRERS